MDKIFSPIKGRIIEFLNNQGISKELFYKNTGITSSNFKGRGALSEIGGYHLAKILTTYPELSARWLILGTGRMFSTKVATNVVSEDQVSYKSKCLSCAEKERTIKAQEELISSLKREISLISRGAGGIQQIG